MRTNIYITEKQGFPIARRYKCKLDEIRLKFCSPDCELRVSG